MLRLILFIIIAFIVWKIASAVVRLLLGPPGGNSPRRSPPSRPIRPQEPLSKDIKDADFEDITPPRT